MLQKGDIVLVRKTGGFRLISDILVWWQNSKVASHVGIITDAEKLEIYDARMYQKSKIINIDKFFDGQHDITILRYDPELTDEQKDKIVGYLKNHLKVKYDNSSIWSLVSNRDTEDKDKLNCAEATLLSYHNAGLLTKRTIEYILPHTYYEFYMADRFKLVKSLRKPKDVKEL